ncbi:MAG TPA: TonB family protein [Rhizomicrobium sp.]|jgi:TonB family protein|nr:TonB family protein [Rhizomicrobium sp.]
MIRNAMLAAIVAAGLWSMASPAVAAAPDPMADCSLHPIIATHKVPPYPAESSEQHEQGATTLAVTINAQGVPTGVSLDKSSGFERLDDAAKIWVLGTWRWQPLAASCTRDVRTLVKINFVLTGDTTPTLPSLTINASDADFPSGAKDAKESGNAVVIVYVDDKGSVVATRVGSSTTFNDLDERAVYLAKRRAFQAPSIDGKPVPGMFWIVVKFAPPPT